MGNTHLKRSSLIVFGIFILIYPEYLHILGKPPNVCTHYHSVLTKLLFYDNCINRLVFSSQTKEGGCRNDLSRWLRCIKIQIVI